MAEIGDLALPSFQRSYVWKSRETIEDYLLAVFENRPTGVFLILKTNGQPQLPSRSLRGIDIDVTNAAELLLDGQQRLTSLWRVLNGRTDNFTYYAARLTTRPTLDMSVRQIESVSDRSPRGKKLKNPKASSRRESRANGDLTEWYRPGSYGRHLGLVQGCGPETRTTWCNFETQFYHSARSCFASVACTTVSSARRRTAARQSTSSYSRTNRPFASTSST